MFYLWIAAQIPYTHDDWDWGLAVGMEQFLHATVNSRYAGNFFEIIMTRSELLKVVIMGAGYFLIPYLSMQIVAREQGIDNPNQRILLFLLCNCMLLTMNRIMWRQVYGWVAGFANFSISAVFVLFWVSELFITFDEVDEKRQNSVDRVLLRFVGSFCGQLFLENIAIYCAFLSLVLCGIHFLRSRRIPGRVLAMCLGAGGGLAVMFSSSLYQTLFTTGYAVDKYRVIPFLGYGNAFGAVREFMVQGLHLGVELYFNNIVLSMTVLAVFVGLLSTKGDMRYRRKAVVINCILLIAFSACGMYDKRCETHSTYVYCGDFLVSVAYFLTIGVEIFFLFEKEKRGKLLALWLSPPVLIAPLLVTTEIGQRLYFTTNIFVLVFVLIVFAELMGGISAKTRKKAGSVCLCAVLLLFGFYGRIYSDIGDCKEARNTLIRDAVEMEQPQIVLPMYPHREYLHFPDPINDWRVPFFKEFYGIPDQVILIFESLR